MESDALSKLLAEGLSQREIAKKFSISQTTVRYWLDKFGLLTEFQGQDFCCKVCGERDKTKLALRHGKPCRTICKGCDSRRAIDRARRNKLLAIEYKGGRCSVCGYCKNYAALCFHHLDPTKKDPNFDKMKFWGFARIRVELDKCVLVCSNCHVETHHPFASMM